MRLDITVLIIENKHKGVAGNAHRANFSLALGKRSVYLAMGRLLATPQDVVQIFQVRLLCPMLRIQIGIIGNLKLTVLYLTHRPKGKILYRSKRAA